MDGGCELSMMFEHGYSRSGDLIYRTTGAHDVRTDAQMAGSDEPFQAPIETVSRPVKAAEFHVFKELDVADKLRVTDLPEQRYVAPRAEDETAFRVPHPAIPPARSASSTSCKAAPCRKSGPTRSCQHPR